jgi:hypothetical protein
LYYEEVALRGQRVLRLIAIMALCSSAANTSHAAVIRATSCSQTHVQTAIGMATTGDTVLVPSGSSIWTSGVSIPNSKKITLQGAGMGSTIITANPIGMVVELNQSGSRVTGFRFNNGTVRVDGHGWRVDHCKFYNNQVLEGVYAYGAVLNDHPTGIVDHCDFTNSRVLALGTSAMLSENSTQHFLWAQPLTLGTGDAVYVEDCTFLATVLYNAIDSNYGGNYVLRYCTLVDIYIEAHSVQGNNRAARSWEIYENTIRQSAMGVYMPFRLRGGTGVVFNNTISGTFGYPQIGLDNIRSCNNVAPWGLADGTSPADGNTPGQKGWPCRDQIGRSTDQWVWTTSNPYPPQASAPAYFWNNWHASSPVVGVNCQCTQSGLDIQEGRDYFNTQKPGYAAYTYPHPLIQVWDAASGGGAVGVQPPEKLRIKQ